MSGQPRGGACGCLFFKVCFGTMRSESFCHLNYLQFNGKRSILRARWWFMTNYSVMNTSTVSVCHLLCSGIAIVESLNCFSKKFQNYSNILVCLTALHMSRFGKNWWWMFWRLLSSKLLRIYFFIGLWNGMLYYDRPS